MELDVKKISDSVKMQEWMLTVRTCRESGLSVTKWCSLNNVSESAYYYWLKKIRKLAVENYNTAEIVEVHPPVQYEPSAPSAVFYRGDTKIELNGNCPEWMVKAILDKLC